MFVSKIKSEQCSRCKINNQRAQNTNKRNNTANNKIKSEAGCAIHQQ